MLIHSQIVEFKAEEASTFGYLAHPKGEGTFPGVVVLQEWWGIDTHIQQVTERLAQEGFAALAPDLYRGQVATTVEEAQRLAQQLDRQSALQEIQQAIAYLENSTLVTPNKVGLLGFGMGGSLAAMLASTGHQPGALVIFYGGSGDPNNPSHQEAIQTTNAPLLGIYGGEDETISPEYIRWLEDKLTAYGKEHQIIVYPQATRSFFNTTQDSYRAEDADDAWQHTLAWLRKYLVKG
ncbi:dienelactone hydrolase family protein [Dictyobacter kobayashii]|uniref:Carboxymethylenebutenolidase n=1 Tax=Dictyobacter kobayashii TaxID=2014872 RepID=A0A402AW09_9CHLR|nr:dienelactone hydrolase family protein [Dictyobacter kobayashii]GCE23288.1 carboxymethylenebutenolidase [Dictyobacter kobayashii]